MTQLTPGSKLSLDQWLFERIESAKDVPALMDVGNDILDLKLDEGHEALFVWWKKAWAPFFQAGIVDRAEKFLYYEVRRDLQCQAAKIRARLEAGLASFEQSILAVERAAQQH